MDVTITLTQDEANAVIARAQRSSRGFIRAAATKMREQVHLPLRCPVTFKTPEAEACGDFTEYPVTEREGVLAAHLEAAHGYSPEGAVVKAERTLARWDGTPKSEFSYDDGDDD